MSPRNRLFAHSAFSLIELMIAIVILGLGLIMVATMFPVAWDRAREMSEVTSQQTMVPAMESSISGLVPVAGYDESNRFESGCFAGDLIFDELYVNGKIVAYADTRVHALHLENLPFTLLSTEACPETFPGENPWSVELMPPVDDGTPDALLADLDLSPAPGFPLSTYHTPRVGFFQRVYPPLTRCDPTKQDDSWKDKLDTRRFAWAVFHRLQNQLGPPLRAPGNLSEIDPADLAEDSTAAKSVADDPRSFDVYYVTLRRSQSTNRYARQDPVTAPDWRVLDEVPTRVPRALPETDDVVLPVAWRVQVQLPDTLLMRSPSALQEAYAATGVPTEIQVPPPGFPSAGEAKRMLVQMFPPGTRFIDELTGGVFRVTKRRITTPTGDEAFLTLDREITLEEIDLPDDWRCAGPSGCSLLAANMVPPLADRSELLRTVWVFPPASEDRNGGALYPTFDGAPPVVSIDIRTMTKSPE